MLPQAALQDLPRAGAGLAGEQALAEQVLQGMHRLPEAVVGRADRYIAFGQIGQAVVFAFLKKALHNRKINVAPIKLAQQLGGVGDDHAEPDVRLRGQQARERGGQDVFPDGERRAEHQPPPAAGQAAQRVAQVLRVVAHGGRGAQEQPPRVGEGQLFPLKGKKAGAVLRFQRPNVLRDRGLRDMQRVRGARKAHAAADRQKGIHTKIQHRDQLLPLS